MSFLRRMVMVCLMASGAGLIGQSQWANVGTYHPFAAVNIMAVDIERDRLVSMTSSLEAVEFDGQSWQVRSSPIPVLGALSTICYDRVRQETIVTFDVGATYAWNGDKWILKSSQFPVTTTSIATTTYHTGRRTIMGISYPGLFSSAQLWEWDGSSWSAVTTGAPLPANHTYFNLVYDASRDRLVTYGPLGPHPVFSTQNIYHTQTFEWDDVGGWSLVSTVGPATDVSSLAYDEARGCVILADTRGGGAPSAVWERLGKDSWQQRVGPSATIGSLTYDARERRVLAVRTQPLALLSYQPVHPATFSTFASGCPGPLGTPSITLSEAHTAAWIGDTLEVTLHRLPGALAGLFLGYSNTLAAGLPLPWDLGPIGMPDCSLHVSPDAMWLCAGSGVQCAVGIPVPNVTALLALDVYLQAAVPAAATNAAGFILSDAVVARIGSR